MAASGGSYTVTIQCGPGNDYDGRMGLRISSIFVIGVGSFLGALLPVFLARTSRFEVHPRAFFIAKYFGSGVIIATAFIHLSAPAHEALNSPCLSGPITSYSWPEGIMLMTIFSMFLIELMASRFEIFGGGHNHDVEAQDPPRNPAPASGDKSSTDTSTKGKIPIGISSSEIQSAIPVAVPDPDVIALVPLRDSAAKIRGSCGGLQSSTELTNHAAALSRHAETHNHQLNALELNQAVSRSNTIDAVVTGPRSSMPGREGDFSYPPGGDDHLGHGRSHQDDREYFAAQMTAIFILEFGVIFHSIFIGLTLAVAGSEFIVLYIVLVFHQTFEGLGLGSRLAAASWPKSKGWMPWFLGSLYGVTTPIAIAVGLGVRQSFQPGSSTSLIANGVFDSVSAGILIYTGLVELMAHEFMFNQEMRQGKVRKTLGAYSCMCVGAGLMAVLGKWA